REHLGLDPRHAAVPRRGAADQRGHPRALHGARARGGAPAAAVRDRPGHPQRAGARLMAEIDDALAASADVEGWLTPAQAKRLWERASELGPVGRVVEI